MPSQYFEMMGQWALYHEGWLLSTQVNRTPWEAFGAANPDPLNNQVLQLYNLDKGSQSQDIAAKYADKVKEMKQMFIDEAKKHQVFPMDASVAARIVAPRPNITAGRTEFVYTKPMTGLPQGDSPSLLDSSYTITADIEVPQGGAEGMILTSGGRFAGYGFYLLKGKPVFLWNLIDLKRVKWEGPDALTPGKHIVEFGRHAASRYHDWFTPFTPMPLALAVVPMTPKVGNPLLQFPIKILKRRYRSTLPSRSDETSRGQSVCCSPNRFSLTSNKLRRSFGSRSKTFRPRAFLPPLRQGSYLATRRKSRSRSFNERPFKASGGNNENRLTTYPRPDSEVFSGAMAALSEARRQ